MSMWDRLGSGAFRRGYIAESVSQGLAAQMFALMTSRGMNAAEVAKAAKVKRDDVVRICAGSFDGDIRKLVRIAAVFDVALSAKFLPFSEALGELGYIPSYDEQVLSDSDTLGDE